MVPGTPLKVVCSTFSTVTALLWVQNQSRPTETDPREEYCQSLGDEVYLSWTRVQTGVDAVSCRTRSFKGGGRRPGLFLFWTLCSVRLFRLSCSPVDVCAHPCSSSCGFSLELLLMMLNEDCASTEFSAALCYPFDPAVSFSCALWFCLFLFLLLFWCVPLDIPQTLNIPYIVIRVTISGCVWL